jgi:hypothetical protein
MSRSIFTRANSARSSAISICSGLTGLLPAPPSRPRCSALIQLCNVCSANPRIFAVAAMLWPVLASRTASSLNSSVYRALVVPVTSVLLAVHFELLSKGSGFQGQGHFAVTTEKPLTRD